MALAGTGPLALKLTIRTEELIKNPSLPETDVSIREISESAGFDEPDAFSEFYGYSSAILPTMASIRVSGGPGDSSIAFAATPATNGFVAITSRGFYFGTDSRGPQYNTRYQVDTSNSLGEFSKNFTGLAGSRTYYCWGYVQNQIGEGYTSRGAATTLRQIPITTSEGSYAYLVGPKANVTECFYSCVEGWDINRFKTDAESSSAMSYFGCMYLDVNQRVYMDYAYLHPYYGWTGNGGRYANRYDNVRKCTYDSGWQGPYGWGEANHRFDGNFTMKKPDNGATRQRNQMHTDTYASRNGGYGGVINSQIQGGWFRRQAGYFGSHNQYTKSGSVYYSQNYGSSFSQYHSGESGGYAPYYDWYIYIYGQMNFNNQYSQVRINNDHVGYFYTT